MKLNIFVLAVALSLVGFSGSTVRAELPIWNPFKSDEPAARTPAKPRNVAKAQSNWWPWTTTTTSAPVNRGRRPEPSTWEKMNATTKNAWEKTKQTLTPWETEKTSVRPKQPVNSNKLSTNKQSNAEQSGMKPIKTVNDFLDLPRPEFAD